MAVKSYCIILWNHVFERYECFNESGYGARATDLEGAQKLVKSCGYTEVPVNSKIGRQILAKIGARKV